MVVSRRISSDVFPQLLAIACLTIAGFQLALSLLLFFRLSISHIISQEEWLNQLTIIVKKKQEIQLFVDEGWYSEEDLVELGWSKLFPQLFAKEFLSMAYTVDMPDRKMVVLF